MKILLIRFSSIGDIVLTSPVIRCVRNKWPDAELHYLTKPAFASLLEHHPGIDRIHRLKDPIHQSLTELKSEQFDLVIDLHKNLRSRYFKRGLNAKSIAFNKLNIQKYLFTQWKIDRLPKQHLVDRYFDGLRSVGVVNDGKGLEFHIDPQANATAERFGLQKNAYVVMAIGGTYPTKRLPNPKIAELVDREERPVVLLGGPDDKDNEQRILELATKDAKGLSGQLNFHESAALIRDAAHVYCHDSGMMHIAVALDRPLSVIWGNTHPRLGMYAYSPSGRVVDHQVELSCRPCSKLGFDQCPKKHFNCMQMQNVEDIVKKSRSVE